MLSPLAIPSLFGLIDCRDFYTKCEEIFDPTLDGKPVVVLSNNDGCVISRNRKARKIVPMGAPLFEYEKLLNRHDTEILSSNYELYGDMSRRFKETLETFTPDVERDSIDESYVEYGDTPNVSFDYLGREIQDKVYKWTHLVVNVGFGATKTLAKAANKIAKTSEKAQGVVNLYKVPYLDKALQRVAVGDVWNIGRATIHKLQNETEKVPNLFTQDVKAILKKWNVETAYDYKFLAAAQVKHAFRMMGLRVLRELNGIRCYDLERTTAKKKSIRVIRSFGEPVENESEVYHAVSSFLQIAVTKMREHQLAARSVTVIVETSSYRPNYYHQAHTFKSAYPSDNLLELQNWVAGCFERIYKSGLSYTRAGVYLDNLMLREGITQGMFRDDPLIARREALQKAMDEINTKYGKYTVRLAAAVPGRWEAKARRRSPRYTTRFNEVIKLI